MQTDIVFLKHVQAWFYFSLHKKIKVDRKTKRNKKKLYTARKDIGSVLILFFPDNSSKSISLPIMNFKFMRRRFLLGFVISISLVIITVILVVCLIVLKHKSDQSTTSSEEFFPLKNQII
jgi:hypothetical protein